MLRWEAGSWEHLELQMSQRMPFVAGGTQSLDIWGKNPTVLTALLFFSPQVHVWYGGQECTGLVEQHSWAEDKVTVWLLDQKLQICCKVEEVWLADPQGPIPQVPPLEPRAQAPAFRPVSRNIDVPKRFV